MKPSYYYIDPVSLRCWFIYLQPMVDHDGIIAMIKFFEFISAPKIWHALNVSVVRPS